MNYDPDADPNHDLVGVEARLEQLTEPRATLHEARWANRTDDGHYFPTIRTWPHPTIDGAHIVALRYAYLTDGEGGDGWTEYGVNMRAYELVRFARLMADMFGDFADDVEA